jgi:hypothetical protein
MVFDTARNRVVLTGGLAPTGEAPLDVWEWDGIDWSLRATATEPPPRLSHGMAYDAARGVLVVYGGIRANEPLGDTWVFDGAQWTNPLPPSPAARYGASAVTEGNRGVLLFGGVSHYTSQLFNDTWRWDGTGWTQLHPPQSPPGPASLMAWDARRQEVVLHSASARQTWLWNGTTWRLGADGTAVHPPELQNHAMAYDGRNGTVVMFGGHERGASELYPYTWIWDGTVWSRRSPATSPPLRVTPSMAFDEARNELVMYGGTLASTVQEWALDTWVWDGSTWIQRFPAHSPGRHHNHDLIYDTARQRVLLLDVDPPVWQWDGTDWSVVSTAPLPSRDFQKATAFDPIRQRPLSFSGLWAQATTWLFSPGPASSTPFGTACAGSAGVLRVLPSGRPALGSRFQLEITGALPRGVATVGLSLTSIELPFGPCTLLTDPASSLAVRALPTDVAGFAFWRLPVPVDARLLGISLFAQAAIADPGAPLGFVLSAGLRLDLGD